MSSICLRRAVRGSSGVIAGALDGEGAGDTGSARGAVAAGAPATGASALAKANGENIFIARSNRAMFWRIWSSKAPTPGV